MSNVNNTTQVLDQLILLSLSEIHGISGRKKLKKEDFGKNAELPPDIMVSLGSKKIIDPKLINPFTRFKNNAHALCQSIGIRFMGGYAVPANRVNELINALKDVKSQFYIYKQEFLKADFDGWINSVPDKFRDMLRRDACIDLKYMDNQIQFGFTAIHITPYGNDIIQDGLAGQIKSLADEVYDEVSTLVDGFLKNLNPDAFTQHTINPLRRSAEKLDSLAFISPSVEALSQYMNNVLRDIPDAGKVTGKQYNDILSLLNNLRDPQRAKSFVELLKQQAVGTNIGEPLDLAALSDADIYHPTSQQTIAKPVFAEPTVIATPDEEPTIDELTTQSTGPTHTDPFASAVIVDDSMFDDFAFNSSNASNADKPVYQSLAPAPVNCNYGDILVNEDLPGSFDSNAGTDLLTTPVIVSSDHNLVLDDADSDNEVLAF